MIQRAPAPRAVSTASPLPAWCRAVLLVYDAVWTLVVLGWIAWKRLRSAPMHAERRWERLGVVPARPAAAASALWVHAVSIGELHSVRPVLEKWRAEHPEGWILLSTSHPQAYKLALAEPGAADAVCLMPWDQSTCVRRALERARPDVVALVECELWPRFILEAHERGARVAMINARIYERDFPRYRLARAFFARLLERMEYIGAQSEADRERFLTLGAPARRVRVAGNTKFDVRLPADFAERVDGLRRILPLGPGPLWAWASTHEGEEAALVACVEPLFRRWPTMQILVAPRHTSRALAVAALLRRAGMSVATRSALPLSVDAPPRAIVLDTVGELPAAMALSNLVFVGGSLVPKGGQNPIEPALLGKPILMGPSRDNFQEVSRAFLAAESLVAADDARSVANHAEKLLADRLMADAMGRRARFVVRASAGAAERLARALGGLGP